jgi:predicted RNase H-like nuclease (RuvC/YqgF family)
MISFFAKTIKVGMCTVGLLGLAGVAAYAVAGKERTHAVMEEMHGQLLDAIDERIEDPAALRTQLRDMEKEYPKRIAQVNHDLAEIQAEISGLERELAISERVVALADEDLARMQPQLESQISPVADSGQGIPVRAVRLDDHVYSPSRAKVRMNQIASTRVAYSNRAADAQHNLLYLQKQSARLEELLAKLEGERTEFQTQIMNLSREIDSIARNDRLIKLLDKRNRTINECSRYEAASLDQITGRLASIRSRQEAALDLLSNAEEESDYEDLARMQLATEKLETRNRTYLESPTDL